jgi:hypothetical protein
LNQKNETISNQAEQINKLNNIIKDSQNNIGDSLKNQLLSLASGICKNFGSRQFINNLELPTQNELDDNTTDDMVKYSITK